MYEINDFFIYKFVWDYCLLHILTIISITLYFVIYYNVQQNITFTYFVIF